MAINYSLVKLASKFGDKAGVPKFYARAQMNESISLNYVSFCTQAHAAEY